MPDNETTNAETTAENTAGENTANSAEFPTKILHEFDGRKVKATVARDDNNELVVTVVPFPLLNEAGEPVQEEVTQPKKDEEGSAVLNEDGTNVLEPVLNEDGTPKTQEALDPLSGRFIKFPPDYVFPEDTETWE